MKFKRFLFICCILMTFLVAGTVSAANNDSSDILNNEELNLNNISQQKIQTNEEWGSFRELQNEINNAGGTLILNKNYAQSDENASGVLINKSLTLDGVNHTVSGNHISGIFTITSDNVVLKNIKFINAKTADYSSGGAIRFSGENITLINCEFENNTAKYGGAVYLTGNKGESVFINCSFKNNTAEFGGAVYSWYHLSINNSVFINNYANYSGGAVATYLNYIIVIPEIEEIPEPVKPGKNKIYKSIFKNNTAKNGGAVYSFHEILIDYSNFTDNHASDTGAVYLNDYNNEISNSHFSNNTLCDSYSMYEPVIINSTYTSSHVYNNSFDELCDRINYGEDILFLDKNYSNINNISEIEIKKAVTIDGRGYTLDGCNISRIFKILSDNVTLKNINFINGKTVAQNNTVGGGAIYWQGNNAILINCTFKDNTAYDLIYDPYEDSQFVSSDFASVNYNCGGAVFLTGNNGKIIQCSFTDNVLARQISLTDKSPMPLAGGTLPHYGGAIYLNGNNTLIDKCRFENNTGSVGAIYLKGSGSLIANSKFFENSIASYGNNTIKSSFIYCNHFFKGSISPQYMFLPVSNSEGEILNSYLFSSYDLSRTGLNIEEGLINKKFNVTKWYYWFKHYDYPSEVLNLNEIKDNLTLLMEDVIEKPLTPDEVADYLSGMPVAVNNNDTENKTVVNPKISDNRNMAVYFKTPVKFTVKIYGSDGKVAVNQKVKFTINKHTYTVKSDKNGVAALKITQKPGKYLLTTEFKDVKVKNTITVKSRLITKNLSKKVKKTAFFHVKVLNNKGESYRGQIVKITFKGKTYKIKTNTKGIATLKIGKNIKTGKYIIKTYYGGLTNINKVIVKK